MTRSQVITCPCPFEWRSPGWFTLNAFDRTSIIDGQDWSATEYIGKTMNGNATVFGVNFADGRIKGYPKMRRGPPDRQGPPSRQGPPPPPMETPNTLHIRYVRGNPAYGTNDFKDNGDPKSGNPADFPHGRGPQGDVIRIYNFVRCVRGGTP